MVNDNTGLFNYVSSLIDGTKNSCNSLNTHKKIYNKVFYPAPTESGWSFIFSWHKSNDNSCLAFIQSLKIMMKQGNSLNDLLFQFLLLSGENYHKYDATDNSNSGTLL